MHISYQDEKLRECCLLLRSTSSTIDLTTAEIKIIRACLADLRAAPTLIDAPVNYLIDPKTQIVEILNGSIKIIGQIVSSYQHPTDDQIVRLKILEIINVGLQVEFKQKQNKK